LLLSYLPESASIGFLEDGDDLVEMVAMSTEVSQPSPHRLTVAVSGVVPVISQEQRVQEPAMARRSLIVFIWFVSG